MTSTVAPTDAESFVLDASALLALIQDEPGGNIVEVMIADSMISSVNWSEVLYRLLARNVDVSGFRGDFEAMGLRIESFTAEHAEIAAQLRTRVAHLGLSLGDRACLALAGVLNLPVATSDAIWARLDLDVEVRLIR